jgi:putative membrane protein
MASCKARCTGPGHQVTTGARGPGGGFDEATDATRRTHLANERTLLAWWRSGLTALGVSLAVGRIVPELAHQTRWPYAVLGVAYAVLGVCFVLYGTIRQRGVDLALVRGEFSPADSRVIAAFTVISSVIAIGTIVVIAVEP